MDTNEPPSLETKPAPKFGFGAQCSAGVFAVVVLIALCWAAGNGTLSMFCIQVVPVAAIVGCFIRPVRGFALGLLLGIGLAGLAVFGICIAGLKNI